MLKKGLTQSDVARISGLSTSMISKIESQYTVPSVKNFLRYIFALDKANKRKGTDSLQASAEETAKYEVKSADYMTVDDERNFGGD
ncbi:helix-turn-helix domain-containing protein [Levilactobacillus brevis]